MPLNLAVGVEPVPGYSLLRLLGHGGFGEAWEATAPGGVRVALKFIRLDTAEAGPERRALEAVRNIRHPHLLDVQFAVQVDDCLVIAMPLCERTLAERLRQCRAEGLSGIPRDELLDYMEELARAVDFLNEPRHDLGDGILVGVQHRDIKPQNVFLVGDSVRLADFGLAKVLATSAASHSGAMTPSYAAPEVMEGRVSSRSDQYSLAVTYVQLRLDRLPFPGDAARIAYAYFRGDLPDLAGVPGEEQVVVARALAKQPEGRWPTCRAFVQSIKAAVLTEDARLRPTYITGNAVITPVASQIGPAIGSTAGVPETELPPPCRRITNSIGMTLLLIPAGDFLMGSPDEDEDAEGDERPRHRVRITRRFYLGAYEVTHSEYEQVMGINPSHFSVRDRGKGNGEGQTLDRHPVEQVSWHDAIAFCNRLLVAGSLNIKPRMTATTAFAWSGFSLSRAVSARRSRTSSSCGSRPGALRAARSAAVSPSSASAPSSSVPRRASAIAARANGSANPSQNSRKHSASAACWAGLVKARTRHSSRIATRGHVARSSYSCTSNPARPGSLDWDGKFERRLRSNRRWSRYTSLRWQRISRTSSAR